MTAFKHVLILMAAFAVGALWACATNAPSPAPALATLSTGFPAPWGGMLSRNIEDRRGERPTKFQGRFAGCGERGC